VLLVGPPGIGKSSLIQALAVQLYRQDRDDHCLSADPGSPLFGAPGAVCLGQWRDTGWRLTGLEALCTLNAGRFRLPLVSAVARLAQRVTHGLLLVDGPGVMRGIAAAELLPSLVQAAMIDLVLILTRVDRPPPLIQELGALPVELALVYAADQAQRPGKRARARRRTTLWEDYLRHCESRSLPLAQLRIIGAPPPLAATEAWLGRQIALLKDGDTLAMGEVTGLGAGQLEIRLARGVNQRSDGLLVRDAARDSMGRLVTSPPFAAEPLDYLPSMVTTYPTSTNDKTGPRVVGRVGPLSLELINGVFGDPLLLVRLRHAGRNLLFDLGEGSRLSARNAHQVSDVCITHSHIDHIAGFLWLLRSRIGDYPPCRLYGPPGLAANIEGLTRGILWDRIEERGPRFEISELHADRLLHYRVVAGVTGCKPTGETLAVDGVLHREEEFQLRAATLEHAGSPVLAFALEPVRSLNIRKDRLQALGLKPGPWLNELKHRVRADELETSIELPDGVEESAASLAAELVLISPAKRLVYATDFGDNQTNRSRLIRLAENAHTLFCEASFLSRDSEQADRTGHLTARACGEIAEAAGVARLVPFHFSRRYEQDPDRIYAEIAEFCTAVSIPRPMTVNEH
jgi:ribonuclease BN (tRNA processing enzyme)